MSAFEVRAVTGAALRQLYRNQLSRDFPRSELKPLHLLEELTEQGINSVWAAELEGTLAAYWVLARLPEHGMVLLDYFAVEPRHRGRGVGTAALRSLSHSLKREEVLLIESEWPHSAATAAERSVRTRRMDFYRRCGAVWSGGCARLFGVDYALLTLGNHVPAVDEVFRAYRALYDSMLSAEWLHQNLKTFRPEP